MSLAPRMNSNAFSFSSVIKSTSSCYKILYIINKVIHGCEEIRNFSSLVHLDTSLVRYAPTREISR